MISKKVQTIWIISMGYFTHNVFFSTNYVDLHDKHCENCVGEMQVAQGY